MIPSVEDQVIDFYGALFERIFTDSFRSEIKQRLKQKNVIRQVEESADAASQSLTRLFLNEQITEQHVADILEGLSPLCDQLNLDEISNPNILPEAEVDRLLDNQSFPQPVYEAGNEALFRIALHSMVQALMQIGPVMAEWRKLNFSGTYELIRRVIDRLNRISEQVGSQGLTGQTAADERFGLSYRDYLLQRFHRAEAGTIKMTTNLDVDLRELFVMPRVSVRPMRLKKCQDVNGDATPLMDLAEARKFFGLNKQADGDQDSDKKEDTSITALGFARKQPRSVIVGAPGVGKSTFFEWLQVKVAAVEEEFIIADGQAIPLLLRVRQLDPDNLPVGAALIEKATASRDRVALMPPEWIHHQMKAGRVLFMLDGLDETEPELRDNKIIPWLESLIYKYPDCHFLISSRPVGYPPGALSKHGFVESDLQDFEEPQILEYTRHWCTAVRLAQNEPEKEARREGKADGDRFVNGFKEHPYIPSLARNPLMLSAICLVNYFEKGKLPQDRARLYELCVEGLLHNWDQRRGIHSEYSFDEKLRACREVALAMQSNDQAEYEAERVQEIFEEVLDDPDRGAKLLKHIRYRSGLLLERRPGIFGFAHLTFQEYLAARAIHEGNRLEFDIAQLAALNDDARWHEVIALFCGLAPAPATRSMIELLISQLDSISLGDVLADAYWSAGADIRQDADFRSKVISRIAISPMGGSYGSGLNMFNDDDVRLIANNKIGKIEYVYISHSLAWLAGHPGSLDFQRLVGLLSEWQTMKSHQVTEIVHLLFLYAPVDILTITASYIELLQSPGPRFSVGVEYDSQAEIALLGIFGRETISGFMKDVQSEMSSILTMIFRICIRGVSASTSFVSTFDHVLAKLIESDWLPEDHEFRIEFAEFIRKIVNAKSAPVGREEKRRINKYVKSLESSM